MNFAAALRNNPSASVWPLAFPLLAVLIWSGNTLVSKAAAGSIAPMVIAFERWVLAVLILAPFQLRAFWQHRASIRQHWPRLAVLGTLGMGMYQGLAYVAAHSTSAVNMGIIVATQPLFSILFSSRLAGEKLRAMQLAGCLISISGLVILTSKGHPASLLHGGVHLGDALMLLAIASNALYGVLLKRWAMPFSTWLQLFVQAGFGALALLPFWWLSPASPITTANIGLVAYAATAASIGAPYCWMNSIRLNGAARSSLFLNLLPLVVAAAAWPLFGETPRLFHLAGGLITLVGVWLGQSAGK